MKTNRLRERMSAALFAVILLLSICGCSGSSSPAGTVMSNESTSAPDTSDMTFSTYTEPNTGIVITFPDYFTDFYSEDGYAQFLSADGKALLYILSEPNSGSDIYSALEEYEAGEPDAHKYVSTDKMTLYSEFLEVDGTRAIYRIVPESGYLIAVCTESERPNEYYFRCAAAVTLNAAPDVASE